MLFSIHYNIERVGQPLEYPIIAFSMQKSHTFTTQKRFNRKIMAHHIMLGSITLQMKTLLLNDCKS